MERRAFRRLPWVDRERNPHGLEPCKAMFEAMPAAAADQAIKERAPAARTAAERVSMS